MTKTDWLAAVAIMVGLTTAGADIRIITNPVRIPRGQTKRFEFGTVPQKGTTVLLTVLSRLDAPGLAGSTHLMRIVLNGRLVKPARSRTVCRLMNRPLVSRVMPSLPSAWFGGDAWRVVYAPDFESARRQAFYVGDPYELVLDVTDLTNPAAENRLEITNTATARIARYTKTAADLVLGKLVVSVRPGPSPTMTAGSDIDRDAINRGTPGKGPAPYTGTLRPGGGFVLDVAGETFRFETALSYPNAGLNRLTPTAQPDGSGQAGWKVRVKATASGGEVLGQGPDYRVRRTIRFTPRKVEISDEITNLHADAKLGLLVRHSILLKNKEVRVRLAGNPDPAVNRYYSNGNPSVYVAAKAIGIGLLCEDDVFRNQAMLFYDPHASTAGFDDEYLCLEPNGARTLRWSVYPVASNDYFDFVNLVRQDWGSNYTVRGAWCFFDPDTILATPEKEIRADFRRLGIHYACYCGGWVDRKHDKKKIGFGTGVFDPYWADFRHRLREATLKIRHAAPECKVLVYYDTQRDTSEGGRDRFRDSWLTGPDGKQLTTEWSGRYSLTRSVVATLDNRFGKAMLAVADRYLDELKADGLYWDEMETVAYGTPLITHAIPDGYSCILNKKTYTIDHEIGITSLLGMDHRCAVIDRVRAKGGTIMGNGPTTNRRILKRKVQRMVEIQHNDTWCYEGNLDSPLGYASWRMDFGNWIRALRMATLLVGTRYTYEHEISRYVFPFTPIELHPGYLLGKERIIAVHSGNYGWPGQKCLVLPRHFDKAGKLTGARFVTTIADEARTKVDLGAGEAIVLERLPVVLEPIAGPAKVRVTDYGKSRLALVFASPTRAVLRVSGGTMPVHPGQEFVCTTGTARQTCVANDRGVLVFRLTAPVGAKIAVAPE